MTPEQDEQFQKFGCACKCLIALANADGNPITKEQFIDSFSSKYPFWQSKKCCGLTNTGVIVEIARELGLTNLFNTLINKEKVRLAFKSKSTKAVLLLTEKKKEADGSLSEYFHCSIVAIPSLDSQALAKEKTPDSPPPFLVIHIDDDLKPAHPQYFTDAGIDELDGYFLIMYRV